MDNIIEFNGFSSFQAGGDASCWLCQKGVSSRSLFCQHCGALQPVREIDHFARLGLERRIDVDMDLLDRHYLACKKTLAPERFVLRGLGERGHAVRQMEAIEEAYAILRDPLRRGRYWLVLHGKGEEGGGASGCSANPMVEELRRELSVVAAAGQCDRVAQRAGSAMEQGVVGLMQALRVQNWSLAIALLCEVDGLEGLLNDVRDRRATLTAASFSGLEGRPVLRAEETS